MHSELFKRGAEFSGTFAMIAAAEIGDKSQLVCMTLASRYRALPIILGATSAFAVLNLAAVWFGAELSAWLPKLVLDISVVALFALFGLMGVLSREEEESEEAVKTLGKGAFLTTFLMILAAELGDKTQISLAALATTLPSLPIWLGATLALALTSALGVWAGKTLLKNMAVHWLHRLGGLLFLGFAVFTAWDKWPREWFTEAWNAVHSIF
jgi:putative Ca2+/H+ antiporter (TMEM165/GDT1 family)